MREAVEGAGSKGRAGAAAAAGGDAEKILKVDPNPVTPRVVTGGNRGRSATIDGPEHSIGRKSLGTTAGTVGGIIGIGTGNGTGNGNGTASGYFARTAGGFGVNAGEGGGSLSEAEDRSASGDSTPPKVIRLGPLQLPVCFYGVRSGATRHRRNRNKKITVKDKSIGGGGDGDSGCGDGSGGDVDGRDRKARGAGSGQAAGSGRFEQDWGLVEVEGEDREVDGEENTTEKGPLKTDAKTTTTKTTPPSGVGGRPWVW